MRCACYCFIAFSCATRTAAASRRIPSSSVCGVEPAKDSRKKGLATWPLAGPFALAPVRSPPWQVTPRALAHGPVASGPGVAPRGT